MSTLKLYNLPDYFVLELFCLPPLPEALQAVAVVAVGHDPKPGLVPLLLHHNLNNISSGMIGQIVTSTFENQLISSLCFTILKRQDFEETHDLMKYFAVMNFSLD